LLNCRFRDHFRLLGQDNVRRYLPFRAVRVRVTARDSWFEVFARVAAARVTGARVVVSHAPDASAPMLKCLEQTTQAWAGGIEFVEETDADLVEAIRHGTVERLRATPGTAVSEAVLCAAAERCVHIASEPVLAAGRVELLWHLREQSLSSDYHRYGNLGSRAGERRREPD